MRMVAILLTLSVLVPLTLGFGHREFGEPCEPLRSLILEPDGRTNYGTRQQGPYIERSTPSYPYQPPRGQQQYDYQQGRPYQQQPGQVYDHPSRDVNETRRCRSERGLRCDPYTRSCKCFETAGASWSLERERCEFRELGTFCSAKITDYAQYCTEFAECTCNWQHWDPRRRYPCHNPPTMDHHTLPGHHEHDTNNGKCLCSPGYRAYDDNSACWYSAASQLGVPLLSMTVVTILLLWP